MTIPARVLTQKVTVVKYATKEDRYGNDAPDYSAGARFETPAWVEATAGSENTDQRSGETRSWLLIVPPTVDIDGRDRVEYNGITYEVIGPPSPRQTLRGPHHIEAVLRYVEG